MMHKIRHIILILLVACTTAIGQDTFIKKINQGENRVGFQIIEYEKRIFVLNAGICNTTTECCHIMEFNDQGDILWEKTLPWLDVASKSMIVENDTIYISGNHPTQTKWLWHQMSANGGDSLATYEIVDEHKPYGEMFNLGQVKYKDLFCIYGPGEIDNNETSLLYFVDSQGRLDTLVELLTTDIDSDPWEVIPDHEGNLVLFIRYQTSDTDRQTVVAKIDADHTLIWTYFSEEDSSNNSVPNGALLDDGRVVFNYANEGFQSQIHSLRALHPDSTIAWKFLQPDDGWLWRKYLKIHTLEDGNIIGFGEWGDVFHDPVIKKTPWIIKVSSEGDMIWQKMLYDLFPGEEVTQRGYFYDGVELEDGSFMVVGGMDEAPGNPRSILIARLDQEGCVIEDCSWIYDIGELVNNTEEVEHGAGIQIYPNPSSKGQPIHVHIDDALHIANDYHLAIYDIQGRLIKAQPLNSGNNLVEWHEEKWVFYLKIECEGKIIHSDKIVRL